MLGGHKTKTDCSLWFCTDEFLLTWKCPPALPKVTVVLFATRIQENVTAIFFLVWINQFADQDQRKNWKLKGNRKSKSLRCCLLRWWSEIGDERVSSFFEEFVWKKLSFTWHCFTAQSLLHPELFAPTLHGLSAQFCFGEIFSFVFAFSKMGCVPSATHDNKKKLPPSQILKCPYAQTLCSASHAGVSSKQLDHALQQFEQSDSDFLVVKTNHNRFTCHEVAMICCGPWWWHLFWKQPFKSTFAVQCGEHHVKPPLSPFVFLISLCFDQRLFANQNRLPC